MTFDLSRRHWWNPTLEDLRVEGEKWALTEIEQCHDSFVFKLIEAYEFCEFVKDAMPDYSVCDKVKYYQNPPGLKPGPLDGDLWDKPMRHWDN